LPWARQRSRTGKSKSSPEMCAWNPEACAGQIKGAVSVWCFEDFACHSVLLYSSTAPGLKWTQRLYPQIEVPGYRERPIALILAGCPSMLISGCMKGAQLGCSFSSSPVKRPVPGQISDFNSTSLR
jgi:hypothetical protein